MKLIRRLTERLAGSSSSTVNSRTVFRNMFTLMVGTVGAKVVSLATLPIITRLYSPEHFGVFALFSSLVGLLVPLATLKYEIAIPVPKKDSIAFNHLALCFLILVTTTLITTVALFLFKSTIFATFDLLPLVTFWWLVPVGMFGTGSYTVLTLWGTRTKQFKAIAKTMFTQSAFGALSKIGLAFLLVKPLGLLVGQVVQQSAGITSLIREFRSSFWVNKSSLKLTVMKFTASYFISIPKYRLPSQVILLLSSSAPVFYSAFAFGTQITGQIGLATSMIALPMGLIGNSVGKAYFSEASAIGRKNPLKIKELTKSVTKQLLFISLLPALLLMFFGDILFELVFGVQWNQAGIFAGIFSVFLVFQFISSPIVNVLTVFNRQDIYLKINLFRLTLIVAVLGFGYIFQLDAFETFWLYSITLSIHYIVTLNTIYRIIK